MKLSNLISLVQSAGVVGAGGAGFPTHQKLNTRCETVIVNGAECEPLIQVDQQLLQVEARVLVDGLGTMVAATGASRGVFAVKAKYHGAVKALQQTLAGRDKLELFLLDDFYPAGDEQVLVYEVLQQVVPPGGIPIQVGAVVVNVETLLNVSRACTGEPVTHKYVSVNGAVAKPVTARFPVGTPLTALLQLAGGPTVSDFRVIEGGPMMGKILPDLERSVTKTTKALIVLPASHRLLRSKQLDTGIALKRAMAACCQCSACTDLCPRHLLGHGLAPHLVLRSLSHNFSQDPASVTAAQLCSECGACDMYACQMDLSPRLLNAAVKRELTKRGFRYLSVIEPVVHSERDQRKIPVKRLVLRLGLDKYRQAAPLSDEAIAVEQVALGLKQHVGEACYPVVKPGDKVKFGQVVAEVPEGKLGSRIHASIAGTVIQVSPQIIIKR